MFQGNQTRKMLDRQGELGNRKMDTHDLTKTHVPKVLKQISLYVLRKTSCP